MGFVFANANLLKFSTDLFFCEWEFWKGFYGIGFPEFAQNYYDRANKWTDLKLWFSMQNSKNIREPFRRPFCGFTAFVERRRFKYNARVSLRISVFQKSTTNGNFVFWNCKLQTKNIQFYFLVSKFFCVIFLLFWFYFFWFYGCVLILYFITLFSHFLGFLCKISFLYIGS